MFERSFRKVLRACSAGWLFFVGISAGFTYLLHHQAGIPSWIWQVEISAAVVGAAAFFLASLILKDTANPKMIVRALVAGTGFSPVLVLLLSASLAFLATTSGATRAWLWFGVAVAMIVWCVKSVYEHRQRIIQKRFIEREFSIEETQIVLRYPFKTDIAAPPVSDKTLPGRLFNKFGPYLAVMIPLAYPIQRLLTDTGGYSAVLLLLAILGLPLAIYIAGRLSCGAYLWVYKVSKLERQHGKPVVFERQ